MSLREAQPAGLSLIGLTQADDPTPVAPFACFADTGRSPRGKLMRPELLPLNGHSYVLTRPALWRLWRRSPGWRAALGSAR
jgi:hypothetical protein